MDVVVATLPASRLLVPADGPGSPPFALPLSGGLQLAVVSLMDGSSRALLWGAPGLSRRDTMVIPEALVPTRCGFFEKQLGGGSWGLGREAAQGAVNAGGDKNGGDGDEYQEVPTEGDPDESATAAADSTPVLVAGPSPHAPLLPSPSPPPTPPAPSAPASAPASAPTPTPSALWHYPNTLFGPMQPLLPVPPYGSRPPLQTSPVHQWTPLPAASSRSDTPPPPREPVLAFQRWRTLLLRAPPMSDFYVGSSVPPLTLPPNPLALQPLPAAHNPAPPSPNSACSGPAEAAPTGTASGNRLHWHGWPDRVRACLGRWLARNKPRRPPACPLPLSRAALQSWTRLKTSIAPPSVAGTIRFARRPYHYPHNPPLSRESAGGTAARRGILKNAPTTGS